MATAGISKPILYEVRGIDLSKGAEFKFDYSGFQAQFSTLEIYSKDETVLLWKHDQKTMRSSHTINAGEISDVLSPGNEYRVRIIVKGGSGVNGNYEVVAPVSDYVTIWYYKTPQFVVSSPVQDDTIKASNFEVQFAYSNGTGYDKLSSYIIYLYDNNHRLLHTSGKIAANKATEFKYLISNLEDNHNYYINILGETLHEMPVFINGDSKTNGIWFKVEYVNPTLFSLLYLENMPDEGEILIQSNVVSILGKCGPTRHTSYGESPMPIYLANGRVVTGENEGEEVDITRRWPVDVQVADENQQHWVMFDKGFNVNTSIKPEFEMQLIFRNPNPCSTILRMMHGTSPIQLEENEDPIETHKFDNKYASDVLPEEITDYIELKYVERDFVLTNNLDDYVNSTPVKKGYFLLKVHNILQNSPENVDGVDYVLHSDLLDIPKDDDYLHVDIRRRGAWYLMQAHYGDGGER